MSKKDDSSTNDFLNRVMVDVKKRPRKIGLWNLVYLVPIALALVLLYTPTTRELLVDQVDEKHSTIKSVQNNVDDMQLIVEDLDYFNENDLSQVEYDKPQEE